MTCSPGAFGSTFCPPTCHRTDTIMTTTDPKVPEPARDSASLQFELRTQRGVRFADSEWELVKKAALGEKISAAEFVRNAALRAVAEPAREEFAALPPGVIEILKHTYRAAYILAILKRDEMIAEGRDEEIETITDMARVAQDSILDDSPE